MQTTNRNPAKLLKIVSIFVFLAQILDFVLGLNRIPEDVESHWNSKKMKKLREASEQNQEAQADEGDDADGIEVE